VDIASDLRRINTLAVRARRTGVVILGGGVVKHHICNANLMVTIQHYPRCAIYLTPFISGMVPITPYMLIQDKSSMAAMLVLDQTRLYLGERSSSTHLQSK
jgi:hypothetical protein